VGAFCRFVCRCRNSFCIFSSCKTRFSPTLVWCLYCRVQWCTEAVCLCFLLPVTLYLSFIRTFETLLQGAPSHSTCFIRLSLSPLKTKAFYQYSTLTTRGQGKRFVVYMTRHNWTLCWRVPVGVFNYRCAQ
jgi:hypothetical protein